MSAGPIVVGLGQRYGGDDAVGLHVVRALAEEGFPAREANDAAALLDILAEGRPVVLVDAVVGSAPGTVLRLSAGDLGSVRAVSSHGLGVAEVMKIAESLLGAAPALEIVGIVILAPDGVAEGLSPEVSQALPGAMAMVRSLLDASAAVEVRGAEACPGRGSPPRLQSR